jgi:hypothetical protein
MTWRLKPRKYAQGKRALLRVLRAEVGIFLLSGTRSLS